MYRITLSLILLLATACSRGAPQPAPSATPPPAADAAPMDTVAPPSATPVPPTVTPVPVTDTPVPTATPTLEPTATPTPLHPLSIEGMRQQAYPGSDVVIEQTLAPGVNYNRYIASYQSEGLKIYALLTVPFGDPPPTGWPVVVFNHGYIPPAQYRTTERYVAYVDAFARNGYIVFRSDYRGHGDSEGEAAGGYGSPAYTIDVLNAVGTMQRYPLADPDRIGMWGHSMGGFITLRAMVVSDAIKAGVIWGGVVGSYADLFSRWHRPSSASDDAGAETLPTRGGRRWRSELVETYGLPEENPAFWDSISANAYLDDLSGPVQLHHGTADTSVPVEFSATLYEQIQAVGGTVELYTYPGDNHNISGNLQLALQRSVDFFDKYVKASQP